MTNSNLSAGQDSRPVFRSGVDRVSISVTVRTERGRHITDLTADDFIVLDSGTPREIIDFRTDETPISLGFLVDFSGSMDVAARRGVARESVAHLLAWMRPGIDRAGLFVFDKEFRELQPMAPVPGDILAHFDNVNRPYGVTSLFDAIAETGRHVATQAGSRRAVVALTDGADNASELTPAEVSGIASSIDVPVYVVVAVSPFEQVDSETTLPGSRLDEILAGPLRDLARWTGGEIYAGLGPAQRSVAARQIVTDLRLQYSIAFEPDPRPGWHPLDVRTRDRNHVVLARSGYYVTEDSNGS
jgi:Ca-activated chloride channel family protein